MSSSSVASPGMVPALVGELLGEFSQAHGVAARCWLRAEEGWVLICGETTRGEPSEGAVPVPAPGTLELLVEVEAPGSSDAERLAAFLAGILGRLLKHEAEAGFFGRELAERYEEITLLYSISEILGSVISLEQAASTILSEVVSTLAVRRATLWVHDAQRDCLDLVAAVGGDGQGGPIAVSDPASVTAAVFRERRAVILEPGEEFPRGEIPSDAAHRGSFLSVPVSYTPPEGKPRTIGVINLIGRPSGERFSAGDQKLIAAIASQVGAAVENSRLVAASLRQERLGREMELAHDLQLKLLPPLEQFDNYAEVAARCLPADSVGGDFYHLFRLPGGRIGVVIGDVSSHGFGAALIMALAMSAIAIHASEGDSPIEVLRRTHETLIDELESTEMYLTLFYGVIDPEAGRITYSNAGHPHAFRITADGEAHRLGATDVPFGMEEGGTYQEASAPWNSGRDLLFLFTDGLSDPLAEGEIEGERRLVQEIVAHRDLPVVPLLDRLFSIVAGVADIPEDDRTALLVRI